MKDIREFRNELLGAKVVDIDDTNGVIYLENETRRAYAVNHTNAGLKVNKLRSKEEELAELNVLVRLLLAKLNIDEDELWERYYK